MTFKKKILASSIAASVAMSSFAALPLSDKGLAEKLAPIVAEASWADDASGLMDKLDEYFELLGDDERQTLEETVEAIQNVLDSEQLSIIDPIWNKIDARQDGTEEDLTQVYVFEATMGFLMAILDPNRSGRENQLEDLRSDYPGLIGQIASVAGVPYDGINFDELKDLIEEIEEAAVEVSKRFEREEISLDDVTNEAREAIAAILRTSEVESLQVLRAIGVNEADLLQVWTNLSNQFSPQLRNKLTVLVPTIIARLYEPDDGDGTDPDNGGGDNGNGDGGTGPGNGGGDGGTGPGNGGGGTPPGPGPGPGGPGLPPGDADDDQDEQDPQDDPDQQDDQDEQDPTVDTVDFEAETQQVISSLSSLVDRITSPTSDEDAVQAVKDLIEQTEDELRRIGTINISDFVVIAGNSASVELSVAELTEAFAEFARAAAQINQELAQAGLPAAFVEATLDLGQTGVDQLTVPLPSALLQAAVANGIDGLTIKANGLEVSFSPEEFSQNAQLRIVKQNQSFAVLEDQTVVSDVHSIEFTTQGSAKTVFDNQVKLRLPVNSLAGRTPSKFTIANIDGTELSFKGGKYNSAQNQMVQALKHFSTVAVLENEVTFDDLGGTAQWAGNAIETMASKGIISGRPDGSFDPRANLTRAEYATLLVKLLGLETPTAEETSFTDVSLSHWAAGYVAAAVDNELIFGRSSESFDPNAEITRAEMAVIAARALRQFNRLPQVNDAEAYLNQFGDTENIYSGMRDDAAFAIQQGLLHGEAVEVFNPTGNSNRAQAAVVINNLLNEYRLK